MQTGGTVEHLGCLPSLHGRGERACAALATACAAATAPLSSTPSSAICLPPCLPACRLGSSKSTGPSARLVIFHDGNALVGTALAVALHGSGAAWPLGFLCAGRRLVDACQAHKLRTGVACAAVWVFAGAALLLNTAGEGAGAAFWCQRLLGAGGGGVGGTVGAAALRLAHALDRFAGIAPMHYSVGVAFRYTLMLYIRHGRARCRWRRA